MAISAESSVNQAVTMNETLSIINNSETAPLNILLSPPSPLLAVSRSSSICVVNAQTELVGVPNPLALPQASEAGNLSKTESTETPYLTPSSSVQNLTE